MRIFRISLRLPLAAVLIALIYMLLAAGCGGSTAVTPGTVNEPQPAKTYSNTPESTSGLLKDVSDKIKATYGTGEGVHFRLESNSASASSGDAEGDMAFPDAVRMTQRDFLTPNPASTEVIAVGGKTYTRPVVPDGAWQSGGAVAASVPDPQYVAGFLDYARGSRNFGQETLADGRKTWHVQVDVDSSMMAGDALKRTSDPAERQRLDAMGSSVIVADYWIGIDDLLPYQMFVKSTNPQTRAARNDDFTFSDWKEPLEITAPSNVP